MSYLVTYDRDLLEWSAIGGASIVTPAQFFDAVRVAGVDLDP